MSLFHHLWLWLTQLSPSVLLFIMSHICQWCFNNSWQIVTRTRDMGLGLLALVFRISSFLIRKTACRNKRNCMDKCHHDSCHLIFISSSKPIYHFQTFSTLPSIRFCQSCFISCAVVVVDPAQSHRVIYFYLILCPIFASDVSTIADRLWKGQEIWDEVIFSVCACLGNAAYIIFIMLNSISGLDAWYRFRFNISCGVAVMGRSHQKIFRYLSKGREGGQ